MSTFNLQIQLSNANLNDEMQESHDLDIASILEKFEKVNWRQQRVLQLQINGKNSVFNVMHKASDEYLKITLNAFSKSEQFEFKIESNIQLIFPQRELFGLMTRKNKEAFLIKQASLEQAQQSLQAFVNQDKQQLENIYLKSKEKSVLEAS